MSEVVNMPWKWEGICRCCERDLEPETETFCSERCAEEWIDNASATEMHTVLDWPVVLREATLYADHNGEELGRWVLDTFGTWKCVVEQFEGKLLPGLGVVPEIECLEGKSFRDATWVFVKGNAVPLFRIEWGDYVPGGSRPSEDPTNYPWPGPIPWSKSTKNIGQIVQ